MVALVANKVDPQIVNPFTCLWKVINVFHLLSNIFLEYLKLAKIAMMHVLGSIEDERCFNLVSFLKSKLHNHLNPHLHPIVALYAQRFFTLNTFPYATTFESWANVMTTTSRG
jgi:hypothetical protein